MQGKAKENNQMLRFKITWSSNDGHFGTVTVPENRLDAKRVELHLEGCQINSVHVMEAQR